MQSLLTPYSLDFKAFSLTYKLIRRQKDEEMGEITLMRNKKTNSIVQVKEETVYSEKDLADIMKSLCELIPLNNTSIFQKFLGFSMKKTQDLLNKNSAFWSLFMIYEYFPVDLEKDLLMKTKQGEGFSEKSLWNLLEESIKALVLLQNMKRKFLDIRTNRIWTNGDQGFKLFYTNYHSTAIEKIRKKELFFYNAFLAPEQLDQLFSDNFNKNTLNTEKIEVFSLALLVAQLGALENKERPYNLSTKTMNFEGLQRKINIMRALYSSTLCELLISMLSMDPLSRPSFSEILPVITFNKAENKRFNTPPNKKNMSSAKKKHCKVNNNSFDSNFLTPSVQNQIFSNEKILNESKSTKRTEKTTISFPSKEVININPNANSAFFEKRKKKSSRREKSCFTSAKKSKISKNPHIRSQTPSKAHPDFEKVLQNIRVLEKQLILDPSTGLLKQSVIKKTYSDGSVYFGAIKNNKREGKGIYYFSHYEIYGGDWLDDKFHGKGVYLYDNGDRYEGDLVSGGKQGKGIYYYTNGDKYDGDWEFNMKHGFGVFYYNNNERFEGSWANNEKHGKGVYYFETGDKFEGFWVKGRKHGKGIVYFKDRSVFEGTWLDNTPSGFGVLKYYNGDVYQGNFLGGLKEGDGVYKHEVGGEYKGDWRSDERNGKGVHLFPNGDKYTGLVFNGERVGHGEYQYCSGEKYVGEWRDNLRHGKGKLILNEKSYYEGEWKEGKREGFGVMIYENGDKFEGCWKNDKKEGKGFYQWNNGTFYKGDWKDDNMNGEGTYLDESGLEISGFWNENELCD